MRWQALLLVLTFSALVPTVAVGTNPVQWTLRRHGWLFGPGIHAYNCCTQCAAYGCPVYGPPIFQMPVMHPLPPSEPGALQPPTPPAAEDVTPQEPQEPAGASSDLFTPPPLESTPAEPKPIRLPAPASPAAGSAGVVVPVD